jgi:hypothetical protein
MVGELRERIDLGWIGQHHATSRRYDLEHMKTCCTHVRRRIA